MSPEGRTIYGATEGSYSDYEVNALFEKREDAEQYVADRQAEQVEEFILYPAGYRAKITVLWEAWKAPHTFGEIKVGEQRLLDEDGEFARTHRRPRVRASRNSVNGNWYVRANCVDREAAIKAVADRATVFEAQDAGL